MYFKKVGQSNPMIKSGSVIGKSKISNIIILVLFEHMNIFKIIIWDNNRVRNMMKKYDDVIMMAETFELTASS